MMLTLNQINYFSLKDIDKNPQIFNNYIINQMAQQTPVNTKYIIRHQNIKEISKPMNMFMHVRNYESNFDQMKEYFVVGDVQFKKKYCRDANKSIGNKTIGNFQNLQDTNLNTIYLERTKTVNGTFDSSKLPKFRELEATRQHRTLQRFYEHKDKQKKINNFLKNKVKRFNDKQSDYTLTYDQQQIQIFPNPQLINLINDNIPEYWKNSLRDNEKRLKRHIKGNTYKKQIAQQMLQTINGKKKLTQSIPKIKSEYIQGGKSTQKNKMKLLGRKSFVLQDQMRDSRNRTMTQAIQIGINSKLFGQQVYKSQYNYSFHR